MFKDTELNQVRVFHHTFGLPIGNTMIKLSPEALSSRVAMIHSELKELSDSDNLPNQINEFIDIIYLALGGLIELGVSDLDYEKFFELVHRANLSKLHDGVAVKDSSGKVIKPNGHVSPNELISEYIKLREKVRKIIHQSGRNLMVKYISPQEIQSEVDNMSRYNEFRMFIGSYIRLSEYVNLGESGKFQAIDVDQFFNANEGACPFLTRYLEQVEIHGGFYDKWKESSQHVSGDAFIEYYSWLLKVTKDKSHKYIIYGNSAVDVDILHMYSDGQKIYVTVGGGLL